MVVSVLYTFLNSQSIVAKKLDPVLNQPVPDSSYFTTVIVFGESIQVKQMAFNILFNNLTIFSVLRLVLINRSYRVLNLYAASTAELKSDFSTEILELSNHYMIPTSVMTFDHIPTNRSKCEETIINVVLVKNESSMNGIGEVKKYLRPNAVNVILLTSYNATANQVYFKPWMKTGLKLLILSNEFMASMNQFFFGQFNLIPLQPFDIKATQNFISDLFSGKASMNGTTINIFMQHRPPKSMVSASDEGDVFTGPDGYLSQLLMEFFKVTPIFWSDIGVVYPSFRDWKNDPLVAPRLHYRDYHKEVETRNFITDFNRA